MKNIYEILKELGIEIPADKKADFDTAVNENYKTVAEVDKIRTARDTYKQSLEDAQKALKSFEGVNVDELKGEIIKLTNDLAAKDAEHQQKLDDMDFNSTVDSAIKAKGAKNVKAVRALLDLRGRRPRQPVLIIPPKPWTRAACMGPHHSGGYGYGNRLCGVM